MSTDAQIVHPIWFGAIAMRKSFIPFGLGLSRSEKPSSHLVWGYRDQKIVHPIWFGTIVIRKTFIPFGLGLS